jgi:CRP-like cAMP-binding protein
MTRSSVLSNLSPDLLARLQPSLRTVSLRPGDVIVRDGVTPVSVCFPGSASLAVLKRLADGHVIQLAALGPCESTDVLTCLSGAPSTVKVVAQAGGTAVILTAEALAEAVADCPELLVPLLQGARIAARQVEQNLACLSHHESAQRLARWLLMLADRLGRDDLRLTQEEMATMTGVQRTTVNASAMQLRSSGLIRYSRGRLFLRNRRGLQKVACGCYEDDLADIPQRAPGKRVAATADRRNSEPAVYFAPG